MRRLWRWLSERPRRTAWVAAGLAFALALPGLGNLDGIGHPDEAFYLSVAADMADHGGAFVPAQDGSPIYQKPPVVFWLAHAFTSLFGRSAAAARLPGALSGAAVCGAGAAFAAALFGAEAAPFAGIFLVGSFGIARFGRALMLDLPLTACLTGAMVCVTLVLDGAAPEGLLLALAGFLAGLSLGVKGPIGPGLLLFIVLPILGLRRRWDLLRRGSLWLGVAAGVAVPLPWYVAMIVEHPREMWAIHVVDQYFDRFAGRHGQPALGLLWGTLLYAAPFVPLAAVGLWRVVRAPALRGRALPALCWIGAFAVVFGLPKEHGLHYPLLILPPLAAVAAAAARELPRTGRAFAVVSGTSAVAVAVAIAAIAPPLTGPLLPPAAAAAARQGAGLDVAFEHPGPVALAAGVPAAELWGEGPLVDALRHGHRVFAKAHELGRLSGGARALLRPAVTWRRMRPYLGAEDLEQAWRDRDVDRLREDYAIYELAR